MDFEEDGDTELEEDDGEYDEGPSQLIIAITNAFGSLVSGIRHLFGMFCGLFCGIFGAVTSCLGHVAGFGLFYLIVYLLSTFLISRVPSSQVATFSARLLFVLQCHAWSLLPVVFGEMAISYQIILHVIHF